MDDSVRPLQRPASKDDKTKSLFSLLGNREFDVGVTHDLVGSVKTALNDLFGLQLPPGKKLDHETASAIANFQAKLGGVPTGGISPDTANALDVALAASKAPPHIAEPVLVHNQLVPVVHPDVVQAVGLHKQIFPSEYRPAITAFYGDPDPTFSGRVSSAWEDEYLVHIEPVYPMVWDLDPGDGRGAPVKYLVINKKCEGSLVRCLSAIMEAYPTQADRAAAHLNWWGGSFAFRPIRGGQMMSVHSVGAAIDLAPSWNEQKRPYNPATMMPEKVVAIFESEGWTWGGRWSPHSIDCMHFQAAHL